MGAKLLGFVAAMLVMTGCNNSRKLPGSNRLDTVMNVGTNATRDTIIMHSLRKQSLRDTIIMHVSVLPDSCKKVPRPPGCPPLVAAALMDTIIR